MSEEGRSRRVSFEQQQSMIEFMVQHADLAKSRSRSTEFRQKCKKLWSELTKIMNSHRQGTKKTAIEWSKYWSDYKNKLKNKLLLIKIAKHKNRPPSVALTKMDKTVMSILGKNYFSNKRSMHRTRLEHSDSIKLETFLSHISNISHADLVRQVECCMGHMRKHLKFPSIQISGSRFHNSIRDTKIKTELFDESSNCENASECSDRLQDHNFDETIPVLNVDCDRPIDEDIMDSICPQWLIETEQKRANADMIRARAEEHQASIAAKTAEAAIIQAEALKKLAEAATAQAEALNRIASLLEPVAAMLKDGKAVYGFRE